MAKYMTAAKKAALLKHFPYTQPRKYLSALLDELAAVEEAPTFLAGHFSGRATAGDVTLAGAKVGDKVLILTNLTDEADGSASFESTITVAGKIKQKGSTDLSAKKFSVLLQVNS